MTLNLHVITPTTTVWDAPCEEVILPTTSGQIGILSGHVSLVTFMDIGVMRILFEKAWIPLFIMGGFAEIEADEVTVLANIAERGDEIDAQLAQEALETAQDSRTRAQGRLEKSRAEKAMKQARARATAANDFPRQLDFDLPNGKGSSLKNPGVSALTMLQHM